MKVCGVKRVILLWAVLTVGVKTTWAAPSETSKQVETEITVGQSHRKDRFIAFLQISPDQCTTNDATNTLGTCLPASDCNNGGVSSGSCAQGFGVCCIVQRTCGTTTSNDNTYFVNPGFTSSDTGSGMCMLTVNRISSNICQMRLDFIDLELAQPDVNGNCVTDFFTVSGSTSTVPMICGSNSGQHMYVDVDPNGGALQVTVDRSALAGTRSWNIKVDQIPCTSTQRAPTGCLQYFTETSGTVESFNFQPTITTGTPQIANTNYGVCIEMAAGYCGIIWERNTTTGNNGFTVSGNANIISADLIGDPAVGQTGATNCMTDYVIIPGGIDDTGTAADRYCDLGFPNSVTSTQKPFTMFVVTDDNETPDSIGTVGTNSGFSLNYRQITSC